MANDEHVALVSKGKSTWNEWRLSNPQITPDLRGADLNRGDLYERNLANADLREADLYGADLQNADLRGADLRSAVLRHARLRFAKLSGANLSNVDLYDANLYQADLANATIRDANLIATDLTGTNFRAADLTRAKLALSRLVSTSFSDANLTGCCVYGVSAWDVDLSGANQSNLIINPLDEPTITVDNLQVAQFVYLLLNNANIRNVIDTVTSKAVLILGRFTPERKQVLDALRDELRKHDLLPVLFDFDKPTNRDIHETVTTLARLARFVVADITDPKSIPQELVSIVESMPSLPVQPILHEGHEPWGMYDHIKRYPWVLSLHRYRNLDQLLESITRHVIQPPQKHIQESRKE
jgi:uncharacterized protein YjbI with pentapeptide repeats